MCDGKVCHKSAMKTLLHSHIHGTGGHMNNNVELFLKNMIEKSHRAMEMYCKILWKSIFLKDLNDDLTNVT